MAAARAGLEDLLPETKLGILRCICGGAESLPARSVQAMALASSEWYHLSSTTEILPFLSYLQCELLTPKGPCKRSGNTWPPMPPLEPHRQRTSEPLGERDALANCLRTCLRRGFQPAIDLNRRHIDSPIPITIDQWIREMREFREEHFGAERGQPQADAPEGDSPAPVWNAAACALPGRRICVAGGGVYNYELTNAQTDWSEVFWQQPAVHVFDLEARRWARQDVGGDMPPAAHIYATAHALIGTCWIFWCGGYYAQSYNTAYCLDVTSWQWRALQNSSSESPTERYFAASFDFQGALYCWGGRSAENTYCADLWRLDPSRVKDGIVHCEEIRTSGDMPPGKFAATLTNCDDRFAVLYGGGQWKRGGRFQPDIETFTLDLGTFVWTRLELSGPQPVPRCQHSAVNLGGSLVLVLGGYDGNERRYLGLEDVALLNVRSLRWMTLRKSAAIPNQLAFRRGMLVRVVNLQDNIDLDGAQGRILRYNARRERWHVALQRTRALPGPRLFFRAINLEAVEQHSLGPLEQQQDWRQNVVDTDSDTESQDSDDDAAARFDMYAPKMLSPSYIDACEMAPSSWVRGHFPSARAGIALADASPPPSVEGPALRHGGGFLRRSFYIFGGAQYVHQEWYADCYECVLRSNVALEARPPT